MSKRWWLARAAIGGTILVAACAILFRGGDRLWAVNREATSKAEQQRAAAELVQEALHREIYGQTGQRGKLLKQALKHAPDYAPARWHLGYVKYQNRWVKPDDLFQQAEQDPRLAAYYKIRGKYADTLAGQLELADWCRKRKLVDQERAHLTRVLTINPDHADARARLGFRRVAGAWVRPDDLRRQQQEQAANRRALTAWRGKLEKLLRNFNQRSLLKRNTAKQHILEINDAQAIPALEAVWSRDSQAAAQLTVEVLAGISHSDASLALARQAVYSPWANVRLEAAKRLRDRTEYSYVPALLSSMYTPVVARTELFRGRGGRMVYRHVFAREGQDQRELLVLDTHYDRVALPGGNRDETLARALAGAAGTAEARRRQALRQNQRTLILNQRISETLNVSTSQNFPSAPGVWWEWWNRHNGIFVQGEKQTVARSQVQEIKVTDTVSAGGQNTGGGSANVSRPVLPMDCLAAGTKVWTMTGPVAVEKVQVGDMVLSQNPETGELAFKPVLRTTIRPVSTLTVVETGSDTIRASGGHPFWVAGEGWVKARDLKSGMELHSAQGGVRIHSVKQGTRQQTYNLIVADFNTYFVGDSRVLNHDNTLREPTNAAVPGLPQE